MRFLARLKERRQIKRAVRTGGISTVRSMLDDNASLVAHAKFGYQMLCLAARYDHRDIAELLIERGADINWKGDDLFSPLGYAVRFGHPDVAEFLLSCGARIYQKKDFFADHLGMAIHNNHADIVRILVKYGMRINRRAGDDETTPLHWAAQFGKLEVVRALLECGANINARIGGRFTPMWYAKLYLHGEVVELLKEWTARERGQETEED